MGVIGLDMGREGRAILMNRIGAILGMPVGGWHGQAKLFEDGDIRLRWLLRRFAVARQAAPIADNVARAARYVHVDLALALVSAAREYDQSLTASGRAAIDTYDQGGLDFLEKQKAELGLPRSVLRHWQPAPPRINDEYNPSLKHTAAPQTKRRQTRVRRHCSSTLQNRQWRQDPAEATMHGRTRPKPQRSRHRVTIAYRASYR